MDFEWSPLADDIRQGIRRLCARFGQEMVLNYIGSHVLGLPKSY